MPKVFEVRGHSGPFIDKRAETPWMDVWLSTSKGRKRLYFAPLLRGRADVQGEATRGRSMLETVPDSEYRDVYEGWVSANEPILAALAHEPLVMDDKGDPCGCVATALEWINRAEAERMIRFYLAAKGFGSVRLKWKRPKVVIRQA